MRAVAVSWERGRKEVGKVKEERRSYHASRSHSRRRRWRSFSSATPDPRREGEGEGVDVLRRETEARASAFIVVDKEDKWQQG